MGAIFQPAAPSRASRRRPARRTLILLAFLLSAVGASAGPARSTQAAPPQLPSGFRLDIFASGLQNPRLLSFSPDGDLYTVEFGQVSNRVLVLPDRNHDGKADEVIPFAGGFTAPNNVDFFRGGVYVGEPTRITRLVDANGDLRADTRQVVVSGLPGDGRHRTRTVGFGPDGLLYVNVGSFNDDAPESALRATILRFNPDGSGRSVFARGLRNTVGFDWDPSTGLMWGTDNGADDLGRNVPPDELNLLAEGSDYGYPYCYGDRLPSTKVGGGDCAATTAPAATFPPHSAPLGMTFYTGASFPAEYWGGVFAAQHSISYPENRGIVFVPFKDGKPSGLARTFAATGDTWVGLAVNPYDGSLFASQDRTGNIYRISWTGTPPSSGPAPPAPTAVAGKPAPVPGAPLPGLARCFSQTGKCLRGAFLNYWFEHGGLAQFGLPVSGELTESLADGKTYTVQYTERARFEWHPENRGKESQVLLGRLGAVLAAPRSGEQPFKSVPKCAACGLTYFPETGHQLAAELAAYWQSSGGIPVFGFPLSVAFNEKSPTDGKTYLVQYFERNRLEYHPENKGTPFEVLLGLLGVQTYRDRYGAAPR